MNRRRPDEGMKTLYIKAWQKLRILRTSCKDIEREGTPVLVFGEYRKALVVTAGLNPSQNEFLEPGKDGRRIVLKGARQRFLHWPKGGRLTRNRVNEAFRRSQGYFKLGNSYDWFRNYSEFLDALGTPFSKGKACHTDYIAPFATIKGISKCPEAQRTFGKIGAEYWVEVLESCPRVQLIFGHGAGWHDIEERKLLGISKWRDIPTPFDQKGDARQPERLKFAKGILYKSQRRVLLYWWCPNKDGNTLCYLNPEEKKKLAKLVRAHASRYGVRF